MLSVSGAEWTRFLLRAPRRSTALRETRPIPSPHPPPCALHPHATQQHHRSIHTPGRYAPVVVDPYIRCNTLHISATATAVAAHSHSSLRSTNHVSVNTASLRGFASKSTKSEDTPYFPPHPYENSTLAPTSQSWQGNRKKSRFKRDWDREKERGTYGSGGSSGGGKFSNFERPDPELERSVIEECSDRPMIEMDSTQIKMEVVMAPGDQKPRMQPPRREMPEEANDKDAPADLKLTHKLLNELDSAPWPKLGPIPQLARGLLDTLAVRGVVKVGEDLEEVALEAKQTKVLGDGKLLTAKKDAIPTSSATSETTTSADTATDTAASTTSASPTSSSSTAPSSSTTSLPSWESGFATEFENITHPHLVDLSSTPGFITSSRDGLLLRLARTYGCNVMGSTSSSTKILSQFIFSLGDYPHIQTEGVLSEEFSALPHWFSSAQKSPAVLLFRKRREGEEILKDTESEAQREKLRKKFSVGADSKTVFDHLPFVWAIDSEPNWSNPTNRILMELGNTLEAFFTHEPKEWQEIFLKEVDRQYKELQADRFPVKTWIRPSKPKMSREYTVAENDVDTTFLTKETPAVGESRWPSRWPAAVGASSSYWKDSLGTPSTQGTSVARQTMNGFLTLPSDPQVPSEIEEPTPSIVAPTVTESEQPATSIDASDATLTSDPETASTATDPLQSSLDDWLASTKVSRTVESITTAAATITESLATEPVNETSRWHQPSKEMEVANASDESSTEPSSCLEESNASHTSLDAVPAKPIAAAPIESSASTVLSTHNAEPEESPAPTSTIAGQVEESPIQSDEPSSLDLEVKVDDDGDDDAVLNDQTQTDLSWIESVEAIQSRLDTLGNDSVVETEDTLQEEVDQEDDDESIDVQQSQASPSPSPAASQPKPFLSTSSRPSLAKAVGPVEDRDSFLFVKMGQIMFRSQLDCWAPELKDRLELQSFVSPASASLSDESNTLTSESSSAPEISVLSSTSAASSNPPTLPSWPGWEYGGLVFDLKTRAVLPIRLFCRRYSDLLDYNLAYDRGLMYSFEREYYDMQRSAFLKYSLQCRIGRMGGVMIGYHNTAKLFGYHYVSLKEMDEALYGHTLLGEFFFQQACKIMNTYLAADSSKENSILSQLEEIHTRNFQRRLILDRARRKEEKVEAALKEWKKQVEETLSDDEVISSVSKEPKSDPLSALYASEAAEPEVPDSELLDLTSPVPPLNTAKFTVSASLSNSRYVSVFVELLPPIEELDPEYEKPFLERYTSQRLVDALPNDQVRAYLKELNLNFRGTRREIVSRLEGALSSKPLEAMAPDSVFLSLARQNLIHKFIIRVELKEKSRGMSTDGNDDGADENGFVPTNDIQPMFDQWAAEWRRRDEAAAAKQKGVNGSGASSTENSSEAPEERSAGARGAPLSQESLNFSPDKLFTVSTSLSHMSVEKGNISAGDLAKDYRRHLSLARSGDDESHVDADMVKTLQMVMQSLVHSRTRMDKREKAKKRRKPIRTGAQNLPDDDLALNAASAQVDRAQAELDENENDEIIADDELPMFGPAERPDPNTVVPQTSDTSSHQQRSSSSLPTHRTLQAYSLLKEARGLFESIPQTSETIESPAPVTIPVDGTQSVALAEETIPATVAGEPAASAFVEPEPASAVAPSTVSPSTSSSHDRDRPSMGETADETQAELIEHEMEKNEYGQMHTASDALPIHSPAGSPEAHIHAQVERGTNGHQQAAAKEAHVPETTSTLPDREDPNLGWDEVKNDPTLVVDHGITLNAGDHVDFYYGGSWLSSRVVKISLNYLLVRISNDRVWMYLRNSRQLQPYRSRATISSIIMSELISSMKDDSVPTDDTNLPSPIHSLSDSLLHLADTFDPVWDSIKTDPTLVVNHGRTLQTGSMVDVFVYGRWLPRKVVVDGDHVVLRMFGVAVRFPLDSLKLQPHQSRVLPLSAEDRRSRKLWRDKWNAIWDEQKDDQTMVKHHGRTLKVGDDADVFFLTDAWQRCKVTAIQGEGIYFDMKRLLRSSRRIQPSGSRTAPNPLVQTQESIRVNGIGSSTSLSSAQEGTIHEANSTDPISNVVNFHDSGWNSIKTDPTLVVNHGKTLTIGSPVDVFDGVSWLSRYVVNHTSDSLIVQISTNRTSKYRKDLLQLQPYQSRSLKPVPKNLKKIDDSVNQKEWCQVNNDTTLIVHHGLTLKVGQYADVFLHGEWKRQMVTKFDDGFIWFNTIRMRANSARIQPVNSRSSPNSLFNTTFSIGSSNDVVSSGSNPIHVPTGLTTDLTSVKSRAPSTSWTSIRNDPTLLANFGETLKVGSLVDVYCDGSWWSGRVVSKGSRVLTFYPNSMPLARRWSVPVSSSKLQPYQSRAKPSSSKAIPTKNATDSKPNDTKLLIPHPTSTVTPATMPSPTELPRPSTRDTESSMKLAEAEAEIARVKIEMARQQEEVTRKIAALEEQLRTQLQSTNTPPVAMTSTPSAPEEKETVIEPQPETKKKKRTTKAKVKLETIAVNEGETVATSIIQTIVEAPPVIESPAEMAPLKTKKSKCSKSASMDPVADVSTVTSVVPLDVPPSPASAKKSRRSKSVSLDTDPPVEKPVVEKKSRSKKKDASSPKAAAAPAKAETETLPPEKHARKTKKAKAASSDESQAAAMPTNEASSETKSTKKHK